MLSITRRRLTFATIFFLLLTLALSTAVFIPTGIHVQAATETVTAPFSSGPNGVTTNNSYTGPVSINVSGFGQASGTQCSDAFYIYTDFSNVQGACGNPITPVHNSAFGLCINNQPVDNYVATIPPYNSNHAYRFTISVPNSQKLTFGVCDTFTSDNTGSFTINLTPISITPVPSVNFAGYAVAHSSTAYYAVQGSWKEPDVDCTKTRDLRRALRADVAIWVGLGGVKPNAPLEQIGTYISCDILHHSTHKVFVELVDGNGNGTPGFIACPPDCVTPGDDIYAEVAYTGGGQYLLQLVNNTKHWTYPPNGETVTGPTEDLARSTAEWIVERPSHQLTLLNTLFPVPDFTQVNFSQCIATIPEGPIFNGTPTRYNVNQGHKTLVEPSDLTTTDVSLSFNVKWDDSGSTQIG